MKTIEEMVVSFWGKLKIDYYVIRKNLKNETEFNVRNDSGSWSSPVHVKNMSDREFKSPKTYALRSCRDGFCDKFKKQAAKIEQFRLERPNQIQLLLAKIGRKAT